MRSQQTKTRKAAIPIAVASIQSPRPEMVENPEVQSSIFQVRAGGV
jgi:hypothetical protein